MLKSFFTSKPAAALLERLEAEAAEAQLCERDATISRLTELDEQLDAELPPLDNAVAVCRDAVEAARRELGKAEEQLRQAVNDRNRVAFNLERQRDISRAKLEADLQPTCITDALAELAELSENCRNSGDRSPEGLADSGRGMRWCATARERLLALQFVAGDVSTQVDAIMSERP